MSSQRDDWRIDLLSAIDLFAGCDPHELATIAEYAAEVEAPPGRVMLGQGEPSRSLCIIVDGSATVSLDGRVVVSLGPGECFGELSLLDCRPATGTVTVGPGTRLLVLTRGEQDALLEAVPGLRAKLMAGLSRRLGSHDRLLPADEWADDEPGPLLW